MSAASSLTTDSVAEYVKASLRSAAVAAPLDLDGTLSATEIADGNLNFAWRVAEASVASPGARRGRSLG